MMLLMLLLLLLYLLLFFFSFFHFGRLCATMRYSPPLVTDNRKWRLRTATQHDWGKDVHNVLMGCCIQSLPSTTSTTATTKENSWGLTIAYSQIEEKKETRPEQSRQRLSFSSSSWLFFLGWTYNRELRAIAWYPGWEKLVSRDFAAAPCSLNSNSF